MSPSAWNARRRTVIGGDREVDEDERREERRERHRADGRRVPRDEVGADDAVGAVLGEVDDAVQEVHEEPVERADGREEPRIRPGEEPAERERPERGDRDDVQPADAREDAKRFGGSERRPRTWQGHCIHGAACRGSNPRPNSEVEIAHCSSYRKTRPGGTDSLRMRPPLFRPRLRVLAPALALGLFAGGCAGSAPPPATSAASPSPSAAGVNQATTSAEAPALPFIEDDYPRALAEARASHKLLFVDGWAPWCHTCLSMRAYTFRDAKVRAHAKDIVWAAIDTEKASNAEWIASHPMHNWPTLFVVDAESGKTVLEWPSSATADELVRLLEVAREFDPS